VSSILLIVAGTLFFLDNLNIIRIYDVWRFWPVALIVGGVTRVSDRRSPSAWIWGGFLILCGALWLCSNFHLLHINGGTIWPLTLITVGVMTLTKALERREVPIAGAAVNSRMVRELAIFSGTKKKMETRAFEGGEIVCVFGGVDLNLRKCGIDSPDNRATIDLSVTFGGVEIRVPEGWRVVNNCVAVFGACEDKTVAPRPESGLPTPELILTGQALFGGISIQN
jgi:hypothetical protein